MKYITYLFVAFSILVTAQEKDISRETDTLSTIVNGVVVHVKTKLPMKNVHVINTTRVLGAITDGNGNFEMMAKVNDTLLFSYLGFQTIKVRVSKDWIKNKSFRIALTEKAYALEEIILARYNLTGYVRVDTKLIPVDESSYRYSISGLNTGYEVGDKSPGAVGKVLQSIFNPADLLYTTFGKRPKQMRKLKKMKKDNTIRDLLASKYDRKTLAALLEINQNDIPLILQNCNYSEYFIKSANDLQILDAINDCYEEYKILQKNK